MNLIQEYIDLARICAITNYANEISVEQHNQSVDRMSEIAEKIGHEQTLEIVEDFTKLLEVTTYNTNIWAAVHILERIPVNKSVKEKALNIIEQFADGDSADSFGFRIWLDNFKMK